MDVFKEIEQLSSIENLRPQAKVRLVVEVLLGAVGGLARVLRQPTEWMPSGLIRHVDPSKEAQERRYNQAWILPGSVGLPGSGNRLRF